MRNKFLQDPKLKGTLMVPRHIGKNFPVFHQPFEPRVPYVQGYLSVMGCDKLGRSWTMGRPWEATVRIVVRISRRVIKCLNKPSAAVADSTMYPMYV